MTDLISLKLPKATNSAVDDLPVENPFGQAAAWQQVDLGEEEEEQPKKIEWENLTDEQA